MKSMLNLAARWLLVAVLRVLVGAVVLLMLLQGGCLVLRCGASLCIDELFDGTKPPYTVAPEDEGALHRFPMDMDQAVALLVLRA